MTPIAAVAASAGEIQVIEIIDLIPSAFNPRKTFDPKSLQELADSIRQHGIQVPLLTRPVETIGGQGYREAYEIIAGHRRHAAASLVGLDEVPCIVREMSDDEAREIALIDNLQREDMPALEEGDAYESLRQQLGGAEQIAARVGKPVDYVTRMLKLVSLGSLQRQALAERLITVDHALLLARLGVEEQDKNLKWALDVNAGVKATLESVIADVLKRRDDRSRYGYWEPRSVLDLKHHIERHAGRDLARAPWSLEDAVLVPAVGACCVCPSNTSHNTSLFADLAIEAATCEDGACFELKRERFVQVKMADAGNQLTGTGRNGVAKLSWKSSEAAPRMLKDGDGGPNLVHVLRYGQWLDVKPDSCGHVRKGVTVDWDGYEHSYGRSRTKRKPGEILLVCTAVGCKVHSKSYEKKAQSEGPGNANSTAAQDEREKNKALAIVENKLRIAYVSAALDGISSINSEALRRVALERVPGSYSDSYKAFNALLPGLEKIVKTAKIESAEFAKALALISIDDDCLQVDMDGYDSPDSERKELIKSVRGLGYTGPDPWAKPAPPKPAAKKKTPAKKAAKKAAPAKKAAKKAVAKGGRK